MERKNGIGDMGVKRDYGHTVGVKGIGTKEIKGGCLYNEEEIPNSGDLLL